MTFVIITSLAIMAVLYGFLFAAVSIDAWIDPNVDSNSSIYPNEPIHSIAVDDWEDIRHNV